jgi:hypothetical protein
MSFFAARLRNVSPPPGVPRLTHLPRPSPKKVSGCRQTVRELTAWLAAQGIGASDSLAVIRGDTETCKDRRRVAQHLPSVGAGERKVQKGESEAHTINILMIVWRLMTVVREEPKDSQGKRIPQPRGSIRMPSYCAHTVV